MAGQIQIASVFLQFPLRDFLAACETTQAAAARAIGVNTYTLNHWVGTGRVPLLAAKALLQRFDAKGESPYAALDACATHHVLSPKPLAPSVVMTTLAAAWDARHAARHAGVASGADVSTTRTSAAPSTEHRGPREAVAVPVPGAPGAAAVERPDASQAALMPTPRRGAAVPPAGGVPLEPPPLGSLPPEYQILLALLRKLHGECDAAAAAKAAAEVRATELEAQVAALRGAVATLEGEVRAAEQLLEEQASPPPPDRTAAAANVRATVERAAPELAPALEALLGNWAGSCR